MSLLFRFTAALLLAAAGTAGAQTLQELEAQMQSTCAPAQLNRMPELRPTCDMMRNTLDELRKMQAPAAAAAPAAGGQVDNSATCNCNRKLGRCSASARVTGQQITKLSTGLASRVTVRTEPPAGQCVEVVVFLQETAHLSTGINRRGHPLAQVISGVNDVEWRNVGTSASRLEYAVLGNDTECWICEAKGSRLRAADDAAAAAEGEAAARREVREAGEAEYRNCVAARGPLYAALDTATRTSMCATMRQQIDELPR